MKSFHFPILLVVLSTTTLCASSGLAQSTNEPWSEPLNLSHSGAATNPAIAVDAGGSVHVFWIDEFDGPFYTRRDSDDWTEPIPVRVPFEGYTPFLSADSGGYLHVFWIDDEQVLKYSNVAATAIPTSGWNPVEVIAGSAVAFDVQIDSGDRFHLAYVRTIDTVQASAGVYYRQSIPRGARWGKSVLLYRSPYFRMLTSEEAHVDVEVASVEEAQHIFVSWDNRPRGRIYLARSPDGGASWRDPQSIAEPEAGGPDADPSNLIVFAHDETVLLVWQTGTQDTGCAQHYQWSLDGGQFWQSSQRFSTGLFGCSEDNHILTGADGPILLLTTTQVYLQAWDGTRWSDSQIQSALTSFTDPETRRTVDLSCRQTVYSQGLLLVVGCSSAEGGDIWFLQGDLVDVSSWFPQERVWQPLTSVTRSESSFLSLDLVADMEDRLHVFWSRASNSSNLSGFPDPALYYTRWEGERLWFEPVAILESPEEPADQPDVVLGPAGRLFLVWRRGQQSEIYFSQATADQAPLPSAWTKPTRISAPEHMSSSPQILVSREGVIYVTYAVPVNEGRGVYLVSSQDGGRSWSTPILAFDAVAAGWSMLDQPRLAHADNSDLHLLWTQYRLTSGQAQPVSLAYARSSNGGRTWSEPELIAENPVYWSYIVGYGESAIHRLWQENAAGRSTLWHERSLDGGFTWERIAPVSIFGETIAEPSLAIDGAGDLHLLQVVSRGIGGLTLQHLTWDGERWGGSDNLDLAVEEGTTIGNLASSVLPQTSLAVILSAAKEDQATRQEIFFTTRSVELPEGRLTPLPSAPVTTVVIQAQPTLKPSTLPTPTVTPNPTSLAPGGGAPENSWNAWMIGGALAGLMVAVAFGIGVWKLKGGK